MLALNCPKTFSNSRKILSNDLAAIQWAITWSPAGLSDRERRVFQLFASALRMCPGATVVVSTVGEISRAVRTANLGECSSSTIRRALADLEGRGYLRRRRSCFGADHHHLIVDLVIEKWEHWTRAPQSQKCPTSVYIPPRQSIRLGEDRTSTQSSVNTCNNNINSSNHARVRANNSKYDFLASHPVLLTLWILLRDTPEVTLYNRAEREYRAEIADIAVPDHSGIPWEEYSRNWTEMLPAMRDTFARTQLLPRLRTVTSSSSGAELEGDTSSSSGAELEGDTSSSSEIRQRILRSLSGAVTSNPETSVAIDWTDPDIQELELVRARTARRGIDRE